MKYKIKWEVSKQLFIEAQNEEEAIEKFWNDDIPLQEVEELEITGQPEVYEAI